MAKSKKVYDDDNGMTVADMSGVVRRNILIPRGIDRAERKNSPGSEEKPVPDYMKAATSGEERRSYILGALCAALLIGLAFAAGLAVVILLFYLSGKL